MSKDKESLINQMNEYAMLLKPTREKSESGQYVETYSDYKKILAKIERNSSGEDEDGKRLDLSEVLTFTCFNYSGVDATYRVLYEGVEYGLLENPELFNYRIFMKFSAAKVFVQ